MAIRLARIIVWATWIIPNDNFSSLSRIEPYHGKAKTLLISYKLDTKNQGGAQQTWKTPRVEPVVPMAEKYGFS